MDQVQIGKFIAELRREKNMTQEELGCRLGVTNKTVSRWENGNYMPDIAVMQTLCGELGISVNELISGRKLDEDNFKECADQNLVTSMKHIKDIRRSKAIIDFFGGTGTGLIISALMSPDSVRRIIVIIVGFLMLCISWYKRSTLDRYMIEKLEAKMSR